MDDGMEIDGLGPGSARPGLKGIAGGLLERLERRALAEQEELERQAAAGGTPNGAPPSKGKPRSSGDGANGSGATQAVGGSYVPGANSAKRQRTSPTPAAAALEAPSSSSLASLLNNGPSSEPTSIAPAGLAPSSSSSGRGPAAAGTPVSGQQQQQQLEKSQSQDATPTPSAPVVKKPRVQPTVRLELRFPAYDPHKEYTARNVPVFDVTDIAFKAGLLLPPDDTPAAADESSSEGGSDDENDNEDNEKAEAGDESNAGEETAAEKDVPEMTASQRAIQAALEMAKRGKKPILNKKRVRDRDEGYDVTDDFVDDSELLINEPKFQPRPVLEGYCAVVGLVEVVDGDNRKKGGRKFGSVNKPKVTVVDEHGKTKLVSEAVAAREAKRAAKAGQSYIVSEGKSSASPGPSSAVGGPAQSASYGTQERASSSSVPPTSHAGPAESHATPPPPSQSTSGDPSVAALGSRMSPIQLKDEDDDENASTAEGAGGSTSKPGRTTAVYTFQGSPGKGGKKTYEYASVSPQLEAALNKLRAAVKKESFVPKNKFPPALKPLLVEVALLAMSNGEYDDNFFNIMPNIFPYNRFTMHKMIKREVCEPRCEMLEKEIAQVTAEFANEVRKTLPAAIEEYEKHLRDWEEEYAQWKASRPDGAANNGTGAAAGSAGQQRAHSLTPVGSDGDVSMPPQQNPAGEEGAPPKPKPKYRFNETARMLLWRMMTMSQEISERRIDKAQVEGVEPPSAINATKARYLELVKIWPEGYMTTNQLSRELTAAKKKLEKIQNNASR